MAKEKEEEEIVRQQKVLQSFDEKTRKAAEGVELTEAEKFLNDTFGGQKLEGDTAAVEKND